MARGIPILHSKLMVPRTTDTIVRRKLREISSEIPRRKIITVTAPAGYGKTILISQAVTGKDTLWYRLDSLDRDFTTFMHHLVEGVRRIYPDFGGEVTERLEEGPTLGLEYKGVVTLFVHELGEMLARDMMIVLDDYHAVADAPMIRDSAQLLCELLSSRAHLIIISRSEISLTLSRLRSMREVLDISIDDLLFTPDEVRALFGELFGITITPDSLEILRAKTTGWVSALILFFHSIRGKDHVDIEQEVLRLKGSGRLISDYLAENVYAMLDPDLKRFLKMTSILPRLNAETCNRLLGITNAADILGGLQKNHLFTIALDEENQEYCYHQLFLEFLQGVLRRETSRGEICGLHDQAARIFDDLGNKEEAVRHYLLSGNHDRACTLLGKISLALIRSSRMELVHECLVKIPEELFHAHPWIEFLRAIDHVFAGRFPDAQNSLLKAYSLFSAADDQGGIASCLNTMAMGLYLSGDLHHAEEMYKELLNNASLDTVPHLEVLIHLVFISSQYGHIRESDNYFEQALKSLPAIADELLRKTYHAWLMLYHGFRHSITGDQFRAIALADDAGRILQGIGSYRLLTLACQLKSLACIFLGSHEKGFGEARRGILISNEKGFRDFTYGWLLCHAGHHSIFLGRSEEALLYAEKGLRHFQTLGSPFGEAYAYYIMEYIYLVMGDLDRAEEMGHASLTAAKGLDLPHITSPAKGLLAYVLLLRGRPDEAESVMNEAWAAFSYSSQFELFNYNIQAQIQWLRGCREEALSLLHKALRIAQAHGYLSFLTLDWAWKVPLLVELYARGSMQPFIREIFISIGTDARPALLSVRTSTDDGASRTIAELLSTIPETVQPSLRVNCLGKFRVFKGSTELSPDLWKSRKAKMLFKLLVHMRPRGFVSKEVFMEHLWPEEDPAKTAKRFHVTLTTLRRILEPDLERGRASAYLKSESDTYLLDPGREGLVDVDAFEEACAKADSAPDETLSIRSLLDADRLYTGDFLEEDLYEPWCAQERERLKDLHLSAIASIIEYFMLHHEHETAIKYCHAYLGIDAYAEDIYQNLLKLYALTGNRPMVLKTYERCRESIVNDLGCPLSRETEMLAEDMLRG